MIPQIDPAFQAMIPSLSSDERAQLEANIIADGCRDPLVVWRGLLVDGHNRLAICTQHGIAFSTVELEQPDRLAVQLWIRWNQLGRRNLTDGQRAYLVEALIEDLAKQSKHARAQAAGKVGGKVAGVGRPKPIGSPATASDKPKKVKDRSKDSRARVSRKAKVSERLVKQVRALRQAAPDIAAQVGTGELTLPEAKRKLKAREREQAKADALTIVATPTTDRCDVRVTDMVTLLGTLTNLKAIITDPPYGKAAIPLYGQLAEAAKSALAPDGVLVVMCGQSYLPDVFAVMVPHLPYRWTMAYLTPGGQAPQIWPRKVNTFWKPVLVFGTAGEDWLGDVVTSDVNDNDKRFHEWGQSESGMARLVEKFSKPGDLVCDPFMGAGTTGVVALALGRRFVGGDSDAGVVALARQRLV